MNIKEFASKPTLIEVVIDNTDIVEKYGETIKFHTFDIVSLSTYFDFYNSRNNGEFVNLEKLIRKLVLDEKGKPVLADDEDLPVDIAAEAISKIGDIMGKSQRKTSTQKNGIPQE